MRPSHLMLALGAFATPSHMGRAHYEFPLALRPFTPVADLFTATEKLRHSDEMKYRAKWRRIRKAHFRMRQMRRSKP